MPSAQSVLKAALTLLDEAFEGPKGNGSWYTDVEPRAGLLGTLEGISHEEASNPPGPGRATVVAHAEHARYYLQLANRALRGENPYPSADWKASWAVQSLDRAGWERLKGSLREEYLTIREAISAGTDWMDVQDSLTGVFALIAHTAYHLGAIRQIVRSLR